MESKPTTYVHAPNIHVPDCWLDAPGGLRAYAACTVHIHIHPYIVCTDYVMGQISQVFTNVSTKIYAHMWFTHPSIPYSYEALLVYIIQCTRVYVILIGVQMSCQVTHMFLYTHIELLLHPIIKPITCVG